MVGAHSSGGEPNPARNSAPSLVALLGDLNIDQTLTVPAIPAPGGDAVASSQQTQVGGSATNTAIAVRRVGLRARLIARVGADPLAASARSVLLAEGVDLGQMSVDPVEPTATNIVLVTPDGERTMYAYRGANAALAPEHVSPTALDATHALHLSGYALLADPQRDAAEQATVEAVRRGVPVTLDVPVAAAERASGAILALLPTLAVTMVGETEARTLTGRRDTAAAVADLADRTGGRLAVKSGTAGSTIVADGVRTHVPSMSVPVVDTTGAGDAFAAGMIAGLVVGLDDEATLVMANTLGALAVTRRGAGELLPTRAEIVDALRTCWAADPRLAEAASRAVATIGAG